MAKLKKDLKSLNMAYFHEVMTCPLHRADRSALLKYAGDLGIHLDIKVSLLCPLFVPRIHSPVNPLVECFPY